MDLNGYYKVTVPGFRVSFSMGSWPQTVSWGQLLCPSISRNSLVVSVLSHLLPWALVSQGREVAPSIFSKYCQATALGLTSIHREVAQAWIFKRSNKNTCPLMSLKFLHAHWLHLLVDRPAPYRLSWLWSGKEHEQLEQTILILQQIMNTSAGLCV